MARTGRRVGRPRNDERPPGHPGTDVVILDAAADRFGRSSYERTTIAEIAEAAGVAHGTVYAHFSSKAELFVSVMRRALRELEALWRTDDAAGPELMEALVDAFLAPPTARLRALVVEHYHAAAHDPDVMATLTGFNERTRSTLAGLVEQWRDAGTVDPGEPADAVAQQVVTLLVGLCAIERIRPELIDDRAWRAVVHRQVSELVGHRRDTVDAAPGGPSTRRGGDRRVER